MEISISKSYTIFIAVIIGILLLAASRNIEYWIFVVPILFIIEFPLHELTHAVVARYYGFEVDAIEINLGSGRCYVIHDETANKLHIANISISGFLFSTLCNATAVIILILVGLSQGSIFPIIYALVVILAELGNTIVYENCDVRRYIKIRTQYETELQKQYIPSK